MKVESFFFELGFAAACVRYARHEESNNWLRGFGIKGFEIICAWERSLNGFRRRRTYCESGKTPSSGAHTHTHT